MKKRDETVVAIKYEDNEDMEFIVPDSKMELVRALLFEVSSGAQGCPTGGRPPSTIRT